MSEKDKQPPWCCYAENEQCPNDAEWEIRREGGLPYDDYTQACGAHVGALLYPEGCVVFPVESA